MENHSNCRLYYIEKESKTIENSFGRKKNRTAKGGRKRDTVFIIAT